MSQQRDSSNLYQAIELLIQQRLSKNQSDLNRTGSRPRIVSSRPVTGGCISLTELIVLENGQRFFVKSNQRAPELFAAEAKGLAAIEAAHTIRVPEVVGTGQTETGIGFLVLELIETGRAGSDFESEFGSSLAAMHRQGRNHRFGFDTDNHLGSTPQVNSWTTSWVEFWGTHRLGYQLALAQENGYATAEFTRRCDHLIVRLESLIETDPDACLIHGDLWSGNYLVSASGEPVLIDPAVYFGSREAEFGMTTLFGGFGSRFYDAYHESWPMSPGWQDRVEIYRLYHLMNHLNLFGTGYFDNCMKILKKYG